MYCQKCRSALRADNSLQNLNPAAFDLLVGSSAKSKRSISTNLNYPRERTEQYESSLSQKSAPLYKRSIPAPRSENGVKSQATQSLSSNPGMSFIEITQSQIVPAENTQRNATTSPTANRPITDVEHNTESLSWQIARHERLFSILSSHSDIDHPICVECSSLLLAQFTGRLTSATRERDAYASFLKSLQHSSGQAVDANAAEQELQDLIKEDENLFQDLLKLEGEKQNLESDLADLEEENRQLEAEERRFWESRNEADTKLHQLESELAALQEKYSHDQKQLEKLQRTNVYNDTFCIGHDGYFGTINGLRLGRLPSQTVEWAEINAAWGQTLLLLATIAERIGFVFKDYKLRPLGSTSRIEKLDWPQQSPDVSRNATGARGNTPTPKITPLDLFSSGDMPLGRVFNHRRFDAGMVAFLDCLSQLGKHIEKTSRISAATQTSSPRQSNALILPYTIQADKIGDVSIKLGVGFSQDENFTRACKYTLTCCKFLLAHVSNLESSKGVRSQ